MNAIRVVITLFVVLLIATSVAGWVWTGHHQPLAQSVASRLVLGISLVAGLVGLVAIWGRRAI